MGRKLTPREAGRRTSAPIYGQAIRLSLITLALASALLAFASSRMPYLPTDVSIAQCVQTVFPLPEHWAALISVTAKKPWSLALLALTIVTARFIAGWRAAAVALPVFFCSWLLGLWLSPIVAQPRPSSDLIRVIGQPTGYAFPSVSGLVYMATFGYLGVLALTQGHGPVRLVVPAIAILLLALGATARIVLGAHWPSNLWGAYLIGLFWILVFLPMSCSRNRGSSAPAP